MMIVKYIATVSTAQRMSCNTANFQAVHVITAQNVLKS